MSKRKGKKGYTGIDYSDLRVYKDCMRPAVFEDKRLKEKYKDSWEDEWGLEGDDEDGCC